MLCVFAILTSLSKWAGMEILPDQADLVQATYLQLILHAFIRIICFKNLILCLARTQANMFKVGTPWLHVHHMATWFTSHTGPGGHF